MNKNIHQALFIGNGENEESVFCSRIEFTSIFFMNLDYFNSEREKERER